MVYIYIDAYWLNPLHDRDMLPISSLKHIASYYVSHSSRRVASVFSVTTCCFAER